MKKIRTQTLMKRVVNIVAISALVIASYPLGLHAAPITNRRVVMGSSDAAANTTYNFSFTTASATTIESISIQACDSASGACTQTGAASGFSSGSATLNGSPTIPGSGGTWTINTTDTTALRILNASNTGAGNGAVTINFNNVHNPSATNSTFYLLVTTYSNDDWTGAIDTGSIAASTAGQVIVTAKVNESLTFTLADATVALGVLTSANPVGGVSTMSVGTNATSGYSVTYSSTGTLTSGTDTITAMTTRGPSVNNSRQFGINLRNNATPDVGADISVAAGAIGAVAADYNVVDQFKFLAAGEEIASSTGATNSNTYTVSYIANIDDLTPAGQYSTTIDYVATARF